MTSSQRFDDRASRVGRVLRPVCSLAVVAACDTSPSGPQSVTVTPPRPPTADLTFSASDLDVAFTDASADPDGSIASWSWIFGDGAVSAAASPLHTYAVTGSYDVALAVTDNDGATDNPSETASAR